MKITLIDHNSRGVETMIQALGICRGNECTADTLNKALDAKPVPHASVLEFGWVMLKVEGISVKTRIQLLRSRLFSTMERSTRSIDMSEAKVNIPDTASMLNQDIYVRSINYAKENYKEAIEENETIEDASYLLPLGIETSFFLAGNLRVWFEYFQKRLCKKHVQDEHYKLAKAMMGVIKYKFPVMDKAWPCKACGVCKDA